MVEGMYADWGKCERKEDCCTICRHCYLLIAYEGRSEAHKALRITRPCASLECDRFDDKKLAQEDKNHLALMLCYRSLIPSKLLIRSDCIYCVLSQFVVYYLTVYLCNAMIFK